jgi:hypothetical protein
LEEKEVVHQREMEEKEEARTREMEAVKGQLEEKDKRLEEKGQRIQTLEEESSDVPTSPRMMKRERTVHRKRGELCWPVVPSPQ